MPVQKRRAVRHQVYAELRMLADLAGIERHDMRSPLSSRDDFFEVSANMGGAKLDGAALARNGAVTLDTNDVTLPLGNAVVVVLPPTPHHRD